MIRRFICGEHGGVAIELALMVSVLALVLWFGAEASYHYRLQNSLHRGTATLADILANRKLGDEETLADRIPAEMAGALSMLQTMMGATGEGSVGMTVSYYDTPIPGTVPTAVPMSWTSGRVCGSGGLASLEELGVAGELITASNVAKTELIRVETCFALSERPSVSRLVFPETYSSHFVTLRKEW